jgi:hypothetical protein
MPLLNDYYMEFNLKQYKNSYFLGYNKFLGLSIGIVYAQNK